MGSNFKVIVVAENDSLLKYAENRISSLENLWSRFEKNSEISILNNAGGKPVLVSNETKSLIQKMLYGYKITNSIFDPTILPILHKIGYQKSLISDKFSQISKDAIWPIDFTQIIIEGNLVTMPKTMSIDAGGIGKGLAADLLVNELLEMGAAGALVSAGGDIKVSGDSPVGQHWTLAIENPFDLKSNISYVKLSHGAIATSSNLKKRFGNRSHLIINSQNESTTNLNQTVTASIISESAALSEVLAKIPFSLGIEDSFKIIEKLNASAFVVTEDKVTFSSENWKGFVLE